MAATVIVGHRLDGRGLATLRAHARRLCLLAAVTTLAACNSQQPPPVQPQPQPQAAPEPPPPPTPLAQAQAVLATPLTSPDSIADAVAQADVLRAWVGTNAGHAEVAAAVLAAGRLDVLAGAAALSGVGDAGDATGRIRLAADQLTPEATPGVDKAQAAGVRDAALAILAVDPAIKDVKLNRAAALALAEAGTPEGQAVRAVWLRRAARSLEKLAALPPQLRVERAIPIAGRLVCPRCSDVHHVTPDRVTSLLTSSPNSGGMICDAALKAGDAAKGPAQQMAALSLCSELWPADEKADPALLWGVNPVVLGLLLTADRLSDLPVGDGPLESPLDRAASDVRELLSRPWALPVAFVAAAQADVAARPAAEGAPPAEPRRTLAFMPELGSTGPAISSAGLAYIIIGPDGVRAALPPIVQVEGGKLRSLSVEAGLPAGGKLVMSLADLDAARPAADGALPLVSSAASELRKAQEKFGPLVGSKPPVRTVTLVVDAAASASHVTKTVDALLAAGVGAIHVSRTASHGSVLPLLMRSESEALRPVLREVAPVGYERPVIAAVSASHVDVWAPADPEGGLRPAGNAAASPPAAAEAGYKGKDLVRLRVTADAGGFSPENIELAREAIAYFVARSGSAALLHVTAGDDARASDVIQVARAFQEQTGKLLPAPERIWPGTRCGGASWKRLGRTPAGCATGVAVAFSSTEPPSSRGISSRPGADKKVPKEKKPTPPPEPPKAQEPPPDEDACDKGRIRVVMNRAKGQFRFCYQRELQLNPDIGAGRVGLSFVIGPSGGVSSARITKSSFSSSTIGNCVMKNVKRLTFPKPKEGSCPVRWPFSFNPK